MGALVTDEMALNAPIDTDLSRRDWDLIIVGAGPAGCWTALRLLSRRPELRLLLLESDTSHGGKALTWRDQGYCLERGPECFHIPLEDPAFQWLLKELPELKVEIANPKAANRFIIKDGQRYRLGLASLLGGRLISYGALARAALEPLARRAPDSDESLADFGRRRLGAELTQTLLATMAQGIFAGDPEKLSLKSCFPKLNELDRRGGLILGALRALGVSSPRRRMLSFRGGLSGMQDAISARLGLRIQGSCQALEVRKLEPTSTPARYELLYRRPNLETERLRSRHIILANPAWQASELLASDAPGLADTLSRQSYVGMALVALGFKRDQIKNPLPGFGALIGPDRRTSDQHLNSLGILASSEIFTNRAPEDSVAFRILMGGARNPEILDLSEAQRVALAVSDLQKILQVEGRPCFQRSAAWQRAIPQYHCGHSGWLQSIEQQLRAYPGLHLTGNSYLGPGLADTLRAAVATADKLLSSDDFPIR